MAFSRHRMESVAAVLCAALFLLACGGKNQPKNAKNHASARAAGTRSVCIYDGIGLRAEPGRNGKWLSSINLGETVYWKGRTAVDSSDNNAKYLDVVLSDGSEGWTLEWIQAGFQPSMVLFALWVVGREDQVISDVARRGVALQADQQVV